MGSIQPSRAPPNQPLRKCNASSTLKLDLFETWLAKRGISWPRTETGRLSPPEDTLERLLRLAPPGNRHYRSERLRILHGRLIARID